MNEASLSHLDAFIFDLDGVIWKGNMPIPGAVESVNRLREAGKLCLYCTNNSRHTPAEFAEILTGIGIECEEGDVMTSSGATALYVQSLFTGGCTAYVVGEDGLIQAIRRTGAIVMTSPVVPQRSDLHDNHGAVDCVIVGIDAAFSYHKLRVAQRLILNGARFIATNRDSTFPTPFGIVPGAGSIVAAIETATGSSPVTLGKPQPLMAQLLMQKHNLAPERTAMIGDRLDTDIVSARRANISALFVATGVHSSELAARAKDQQKPDAIFADLPALCESVFGASQEAQTSTVDFAPVAATSALLVDETASDESVQQEPAAVLETSFAQETVEETIVDSSDVEIPDESSTAPAASSDFSFKDAASEGTTSAAPVVQIESEVVPAEPVAASATPFAFDFAASLDDISATPTPDTEPEPELSADATTEPEAEEAPADDKWWETLDSAA